jgi:hypothetical protein
MIEPAAWELPGDLRTFLPATWEGVRCGRPLLPPIAEKADFPETVMSALPPKADMCSALGHVCFGPIADVSNSLDDFVGAWGQ